MLKHIVAWLLALACITQVIGQGSADTRVCSCFTEAIPSDFLQRTKAVYGTVGVVLTPGIVIQPRQEQPVKFVLPVPAIKAGCRTAYTLYVTGADGQKVYEATGSSPEISYTFPACGQTYVVTLTAASRSSSGGEGNCTRRLNFKVTPQCPTAACSCFMQKGNKGISGDFGINGQVECLPSSGTQHRYVLRFDIVNKSACILNIQSITVHGQTIDVPVYNTAPMQTTRSISLGFVTALSQSRPADSRLTMVVRYSLNGRKCTANLEIPYQTCQ